MAETSSLLNCRTGNCTGGSNPPLSASNRFDVRIWLRGKDRNYQPCKFSGCGAVRLAHLVWDQGVAGSNPATPTRVKRFILIFLNQIN